jgi:ribosomal protein S18 acetylase RimI-like enzyme
MTERTSVVTVRAATTDDEQAVYALSSAMAVSFPIERATFARTFAEVTGSPAYHVLVAEVDGVVSGYLLGAVRPTFFANGTVAHVEELAVATELRRRGIGARLVSAFEEQARADGARLVSLATARAGEFYAALGYAERGTYFRRML